MLEVFTVCPLGVREWFFTTEDISVMAINV
jgi:hypothetical protein